LLITPENGGPDFFVHISALKGGSLRDGQNVSYQLGQDPKTGKSKAWNVRPTRSRATTKRDGAT
jgi:CspA family cold shock protein